GVDWAVVVLALFKLGAVYLPQDPAYPAERLAAVVRRSGCRHVVTAPAAAEAVREALRDELPVVLTTDVSDADPVTAARPWPGDPAYVIFTSGSTGEPKGALIRHLGMLNHLLAKVADLGLTGDDRV